MMAFSIMAPAVWNSRSPLSSDENFRYHHHFQMLMFSAV